MKVCNYASHLKVVFFLTVTTSKPNRDCVNNPVNTGRSGSNVCSIFQPCVKDAVSILEKGSGTVEEGAVGEAGAGAEAADGAGIGGR